MQLVTICLLFRRPIGLFDKNKALVGRKTRVDLQQIQHVNGDYQHWPGICKMAVTGLNPARTCESDAALVAVAEKR
jgi:hypothetical protein